MQGESSKDMIRNKIALNEFYRLLTMTTWQESWSIVYHTECKKEYQRKEEHLDEDVNGGYLGVGIFVLPAKLSLRQYASDLSLGGNVDSSRSGDWDLLPAEKRTTNDSLVAQRHLATTLCMLQVPRTILAPEGMGTMIFSKENPRQNGANLKSQPLVFISEGYGHDETATASMS